MKIWKIYAFLALFMLSLPAISQSNTFPSSGNVGIGTTNPTNKLHVIGEDNNGLGTGTLKVQSITDDKPLFLDGNEIDGYSVYGLNINYNSSSKLTLANGGGNVGVGVISPNAKLHLKSSNDSGLKIEREGKTTAMQLFISSSDYGFFNLGGNTKFRSGNYPSLLEGSLSLGGSSWLTDHKLEVMGSTYIDSTLFINDFELLSVTDTKNIDYLSLGATSANKKAFIGQNTFIIGTIDPEGRDKAGVSLVVKGVTEMDSIKTDTLQATNAYVNNSLYVDDYKINSSNDSNGANYLSIGSNNNKVHIADNSFIIGTIDPEGRDKAGVSLVVKGVTEMDSIKTEYIEIDTINVNKILTDTVQALKINTDAIYAANAESEIYETWTVVSDKRLKKNINKLPESLKTFNKVKLYEYEYIDQSKKGSRYGIMAQEIKEIIPNSVGKFKGKDGTEYYNYNSTNLLYLHMKATQELSVKVEELEDVKNENEILKERLGNLENQMNEVYAMLMQNQGESNSSIDTPNANFFVGQNIPNPATNETIIPYFIPENASNVSIAVTDVSGRILLEQDVKNIDSGNIVLNTTSLPEGVCLYYITVDGKISGTRKMIIE